MDPRIILGGQPVNALAALQQGTTAAQNTLRTGQQRDERNLYRHDVRMNQQQSRAQRMAAARAAGMAEAAQYAASLPPQQRDAEAAEADRMLKSVTPVLQRAEQTGDVTEINQILQGAQMPPVESVEQAAEMAMRVVGGIDAMKQAHAQAPQGNRNPAPNFYNPNAPAGTYQPAASAYGADAFADPPPRAAPPVIPGQPRAAMTGADAYPDPQSVPRGRGGMSLAQSGLMPRAQAPQTIAPPPQGMGGAAPNAYNTADPNGFNRYGPGPAPAQPAGYGGDPNAATRYETRPAQRYGPGPAPVGNPGYGGLPQRGPAPPVDEALMGAAQMPSPREFERQPRKQVHNQQVPPMTSDEARVLPSMSAGSGRTIVTDPDPANEMGLRIVNIPGGRAEREAEAEQEREASRSLYSGIYGDAVIDNIQRARELAENTRFTNGFIGGMMRNIGGTNANDMRALITPILSAIGLDRLESMREQSSSGASGLGALNEQELNLLVNGLYSLEQSQGEPQFLENLSRVQQSLTILRFGPPPEGVERAEWARLIEAMTPAERAVFE